MVHATASAKNPLTEPSRVTSLFAPSSHYTRQHILVPHIATKSDLTTHNLVNFMLFSQHLALHASVDPHPRLREECNNAYAPTLQICTSVRSTANACCPTKGRQVLAPSEIMASDNLGFRIEISKRLVRKRGQIADRKINCGDAVYTKTFEFSISTLARATHLCSAQ